MGNSRNTGFIGNVVKYDSNGNVNIVSGATTLLSVSSSGQLTVPGNEVITGSLTVLGGITGAITGSATSASYAANTSFLNGSGSGEFVPTGSFNAFSLSILTYTGSVNSQLSALQTTSGSNITRLSALEVTSGSNITRISALESASGSAITRLSALEVTSGSNITRLSSLEARTGSYATTGSNTFIGNQTITGSVLQSGSLSVNGCIVSTGAIVAQTINVQQVTSSIVYSCGSNIFGTAISNTQTMTGSVFITGSLSAVGNACFTSICTPVSIITGCVNIGSTSAPGSTLDITRSSPDPFNTVQCQLSLINSAGNGGAGTQLNFSIGSAAPFIRGLVDGANSFSGAALVFGTANSNTAGTERMRISNAGCVGIGSTSPSYQLDMCSGTTVNQRMRLQRGSDDTNQNMLLGWNNIVVTRHNVSISGVQTDFSIIQCGSDGARVPFNIGVGGHACFTCPASIATGCRAFGRGLTVFSDIVSYYSDAENITMGISAGTGAQSWGIQVCDTGDGGSALHLNARGGNVGINKGSGNTADFPLDVTGTIRSTSTLIGAGGNISTSTICTLASTTLSSSRGILVDANTTTNNAFIPIGYSWASSVSTYDPNWGMALKTTNYNAGTADLVFYTGGNVRMTINNGGTLTLTSSATLPGNLFWNSGDGVNWYIQGQANGPTIRMKYHGGSTDRSGALGWIDNGGGRYEALTWQDTTVTLNGRVYMNSLLPLGIVFKNTELADGDGSNATVTDTQATNGNAKRRLSSASSNTFFYGPYQTIPAGTYIAYFRLKVTNNSSGSNILYIDITNSVSTGINIAPNSFAASNRYQYFKIPFTVTDPTAAMEFRGLSFTSGITDIFLDHIMILPGS